MRLLLAAILMLPGVATADPEYRRYVCRSGIDVAVAAIPGDGGSVLVMAPEGRQVILLPAPSGAAAVSLHVETPEWAHADGRYLWREREKSADELADPSRLAWVVELGWRTARGETLVDMCRRLPG
ncbi:MAG: hypothetical protein KF887_13310 [Paracoccaceae bacterium]|nr:MAG: hypothetical protein KF887_13310 [Paracoccaceae bacterium]